MSSKRTFVGLVCALRQIIQGLEDIRIDVDFVLHLVFMPFNLCGHKDLDLNS